MMDFYDNCKQKPYFIVLKGVKYIEEIKFRIIKESENMCRIETSDCRSVYRKIADGACICSLEVMLGEIEHITNEVNKLGNKAVFVM